MNFFLFIFFFRILIIMKQVHTSIFRETDKEFLKTLALFGKYNSGDLATENYTYFNIKIFNQLEPENDIYYMKSKDLLSLILKMEKNTDKVIKPGYTYFTFCSKQTCGKCSEVGHIAKACESKRTEETPKKRKLSISDSSESSSEFDSDSSDGSINMDSEPDENPTPPERTPERKKEKIKTPFNSRKSNKKVKK